MPGPVRDRGQAEAFQQLESVMLRQMLRSSGAFRSSDAPGRADAHRHVHRDARRRGGEGGRARHRPDARAPDGRRCAAAAPPPPPSSVPPRATTAAPVHPLAGRGPGRRAAVPGASLDISAGYPRRAAGPGGGDRRSRRSEQLGAPRRGSRRHSIDDYQRPARRGVRGGPRIARRRRLDQARRSHPSPAGGRGDRPRDQRVRPPRPPDHRRRPHAHRRRPARRRRRPHPGRRAGVVREAGPRGGYGNAVEIDHGDGTSTLYAHASALVVQTGQHVDGARRWGWWARPGRRPAPTFTSSCAAMDTPSIPTAPRTVVDTRPFPSPAPLTDIANVSKTPSEALFQVPRRQAMKITDIKSAGQRSRGPSR